MKLLMACALVVFLLSVVLNYLFNNYHGFKDNFETGIDYDYVIVGGGTAGCVLANRLSTDLTKRVLVVEAGDYPRGWTGILSKIPIAVMFLLGSEIDWKYWTTSQVGVMKALKSRRYPLPAGRVFGGTSAINAMIYARGQDGRDFDQFPGWTENEKYYARAVCGNGTEVRNCLSLAEVDGLPELSEAFLEAGRLTGSRPGFVKPQVCVNRGSRQAMFDAFIRPILTRSNLYRLTKTEVHKVTLRLENELISATGVVASSDDGRRHKIVLRTGGEVIIAAGAMASPKILVASGVGRNEVLRRVNATQFVDLPVGENVQDHPFLGIYFAINRTLSLTTRKLISLSSLASYLLEGAGPLAHASGLTGIGYVRLNGDGAKPEALPYSSAVPRDIELLSIGVGSIINDVMKRISNFDEESWETFEPPNYRSSEEGFLLNVVLLRPKSRGRLVMTNLTEKATVNVGYLSNGTDVENLVTGVQFAIDLIEQSPLYRAMGARAYLPIYQECENLAERSREAIECLVRHVAVGMYHITSSCSMGTEPGNSVVDLEARVHGIRSLRVVDASILPNAPSAHPMATVMMMAERISELILRDKTTSTDSLDRK